MPRISRFDLLAMGYGPDGQKLQKGLSADGGDDDERQLHVAIAAYCRRADLPFIHSRMDRPTSIACGAPDFVIAMPGGKTLWLECKTAKGKLTTEQNAWLHWLKGKGHEAHVVRSMRQFMDLMLEMKA